MADDRNEIIELQREWRREISEAIREIRAQNIAIAASIQDLRDEAASKTELARIAGRLSDLESDKAKLLGAVVALQVIGSVVLWLLSQVGFGHHVQ